MGNHTKVRVSLEPEPLRGRISHVSFDNQKSHE